MPPKPKLTRKTRTGKIVPNEDATGARGALTERSSQRRDYAIQAEFDDIEAGNPTKGRYVRLRIKIADHFKCSRREAERAIRRAEIWLAERFDQELPEQRARVCRQLQRIADAQEEAHPVAAVAALAQQAKILGLYAPKKLEVTHGVKVDRDLQIDAALELLSPQARAAFDLVMGELADLESSGRLQLPAGDDAGAPADDEEIEDAELVGEDDPPGESGPN